MAGKFTPVKGLEEKVARMVADNITSIAKEVAGVAKGIAPPTKTWQNVGDDRVRTQHVHANGQEVPDNLRFKLEAYEWDVKNPGRIPAGSGVGDGSGWDGPTSRTVPGTFTYLKEPRDRTGGALVAIVNCRCSVVVDPEGIAKLITVERAVAVGKQVKASVVASSDTVDVIGAEHGDVYPFPVTDPVADGTFFMHRAAVLAGNMLRARQ